ncbi:hypothetical protein [Erwinia psidii]|uniref:Uncharacterized protein n=1 Tax=Erwinia psidii TaxID=69224 RepID=A0A3N6S286_9GAMM|nr:hypothetical protein [Erwinia psidii]MCX8956412.1 hypothetical protein [Erwinia psidii]MCX8962258.1 hypothetical protein [Erwinia psidii]MCX8965803.1 hypothetical protein [Erwinia psidii]RQM39748.1 hypothetical protein EB241_00025 [Erwinia psidii]
MGQHFITPAAAGKHLRDDYGAAAGLTFSATCPPMFLTKKNARLTRSFPVVQPLKVEAHGRLNHVA